VAGVSTRSVDDLVAALGIDSGISKSEVSRICAGLDEVVTAFRTRRLDHTAFPYVYLDATYLHVRNPASQVVSMAVVVATGITADCGREVLGLDVGDSEDEVFWRGFLTALKRRGLTGARLVISDQHSGLVAALKRAFQDAAGCTSRAICSPWCPGRTPTWLPPCSARSSPNLIRRRSPRPGTRSVTSSPAVSRRSAP
jgi:transposase-like protein